MLPIQKSGHLNFIDKGDEFGPNISFLMVNGHTESQMIPHIKYKGETIVFAADLIPSIGHIPIPYIPSYDTRPLLSMDEKTRFLKEAYNKDYILFLEHDAYNQCSKLKETEKGIRFGGALKIEDL